MPTRRQEKVARAVMRAVSDAIAQDLSDPRVQGIVTVTSVEMTPDLRNAEVFFSIYADTPQTVSTTFTALQHARRHIQKFVGAAVTTKFCPVLHFRQDDKFKKTLEVFNLIDQAASEYQVETPNPEYASEADPAESPQDESRDDL